MNRPLSQIARECRTSMLEQARRLKAELNALAE